MNDKPRVKIIHYRPVVPLPRVLIQYVRGVGFVDNPYPAKPEPAPTGGLTVASVEIEGDLFEVTATCMDTEQFCYHRANEIVLGRMRKLLAAVGRESDVTWPGEAHAHG